MRKKIFKFENFTEYKFPSVLNPIKNTRIFKIIIEIIINSLLYIIKNKNFCLMFFNVKNLIFSLVYEF